MELDQLNLRNPIKIGYYDPFDILPLVKDDLETKFPLTNLHWKHGESKLQSIALLPVNLVEEVPKPGSTNDESIYSRLMLVKYDTLDIYRSQVRPLIKEWLKSLVIRYDSEWMIILYIPLTVKDKPSTLVKHSAYDKLKLDFGQDGQELNKLDYYPKNRLRCFKIKQQDANLIKLESINEIIQTLKLNLLSSFSKKYDYLINKLNRDISLENFKTRLQLGDLFNDMRLFQDSLDIYDDLQIDLNQLSKTIQFSNKINLPKKYESYQFENSMKMINLKTMDENSALFDIKCSLFVNQSILLQSLANFSKSLSISAIYISSLFQRLIKFMQDLLDHFQKDDLNEFIIVLCDYYLNLPICSKLIEINNEKLQANDLNYQLHEILEFTGELKLFQRSKYLQIGQKFGYYIRGIQIDINLNDQITRDYSYEPILKVVKSEESFFQYFESITESVIEDFVKSGRSKTIDILSIDLALLNYQKKNYEEALIILQESYDFFISNGWNYMGGFLLEVYLDCLTQSSIKDYKLLTSTFLKLFTNVSGNDLIGISNYGIIKQKSQLESLLQKVVEYSEKMSEIVEFPLESFFDLTQIPYLHADDSSYKYFIDLILENKTGVDFDAKSITVLMADFETNESLVFESSNFDLNDKKIRLYSNDFKMGVFTPLKLKLSINDNLKFVHEINRIECDDIDQNMSNLNGLVNGKNNIYLYQNSQKFWCQFSNSTEIELGSTDLLLTLNNGDLKIEDVHVVIRLDTDGVEFIGNSKFELSKIDPRDRINFKIPYHCYNDDKVVTVKAEIKYTFDGEIYNHIVQDEVDTTLAISVSVQDTFRKDFIYSKFQIGTGISRIPMRLLSTKLVTRNESYEISCPKTPPESLITFVEQPASIFYKIIPKKNYRVQNNDCLDLDVCYLNIQEECEICILNLYEKTLGSIFDSYKLLVKKLIVEKAKYDLNSFAINSYIKILNSNEIKHINEEVLPKYINNQQVLIKIQDQINKLIEKIVIVDTMKYRENKLHISVPIPTLQYLLTIEFDFEKKSQFLVGEPIPTKVNLSTITRRSLADPQSKDQFFQLCLQNDDNWLISGSNKQSFVVKTDQENTFEFDLVLVPLNVGNLALPKVVIKQLGRELNDSDMDLSLQNGLETILVVPELDSITFSF